MKINKILSFSTKKQIKNLGRGNVVYVKKIVLVSETTNKTTHRTEEFIMELRQALPKIVTETVPGPKSKALIDRRAAATATAVKCVYPVAIEWGEGSQWLRIWMEIFSLTG